MGTLLPGRCRQSGIMGITLNLLLMPVVGLPPSFGLVCEFNCRLDTRIHLSFYIFESVFNIAASTYIKIGLLLTHLSWLQDFMKIWLCNSKGQISG